jgi:hypothetical protein
MLEALRNAPHKWPRIIGELIDNSLDANAMNVQVNFRRNKLVVSDDGCGCENVERMLTLGEHLPMPSTKLGRYGVGLKDAAGWMWGICRVATIHEGIKRIASIDWQWLSKNNTWEIADPTMQTANGEVGTELVFTDIEKPPPGGLDKLAETLSYTFSPALDAGRTITLKFPKKKTIILKPFQFPSCKQYIDKSFTVGRRRVHLWIGLVDEGGDNPKPGFTYRHHHRNIITTSSLGAGDYPVSNIFGCVDLGDGWQLTTHKDDIADGREALELAVLKHSEEILKLGRSRAIHHASAHFNEKINRKLQVSLKGLPRKKAKRGKGDESGTIQPTGTGRKHRQAARTQPGERMLSKAAMGRIRIEWRPFDTITFGDVDMQGPLIWLNDTNKHLSRLRQNDNEDAVLAIAVALFANAAIDKGMMQQWFPFMGDNSPEDNNRFAELMAASLETPTKEYHDRP